MNIACLIHFSLTVLIVGSSYAQSLPPLPPRSVPIISPEVNRAERVTFRLFWPNAKQVKVIGQWRKEPIPLTLGKEGVWSVDAGPIAVGIWEYSFEVDGVRIIDPGNEAVKPRRAPRTSLLHMPGAPPRLWDFQDVPHGIVHEHYYRSTELGDPRQILVYTPPGYERASTAVYPLLILQHGSGETEKTWTIEGKLHRILDNLIAEGKARPMVVVMLNGHPFRPIDSLDPSKLLGSTDAFSRELFDDALPVVEKCYRVGLDPALRGIVGLSMGGGQALTIGLQNRKQFSWIGSFGGLPPDSNVLKASLMAVDQVNKEVNLLWIGCGKDDPLLPYNENVVAQLKAGGIRVEWHLTADDHTWSTWRNYIIELLPLLFQAKPNEK